MEEKYTNVGTEGHCDHKGYTLTQEEIDLSMVELKSLWDKKVQQSGKSEAVFIATDDTGFATNMLYNYKVAKEHVESLGLVMPVMTQGDVSVEVTNGSNDERHHED